MLGVRVGWGERECCCVMQGCLFKVGRSAIGVHVGRFVQNMRGACANAVHVRSVCGVVIF